MKLFPIYFLLFLWIIGCQRPTTQLQKGAVLEKEGLIDCFQENLQANGREVWCEASAVLYDGKTLTVANDKEMPGADASVFYWLYNNDEALANKPTYLTEKLFKSTIKYEDFALTPDKKYVFLTTAFDRIKENNNEWDGYNTLLYWPASVPIQQVAPKAAHLKKGELFSMGLREALSKALANSEFPAGMPYFKIEGLAVNNDKLYFGVREEGKKYDDFKYKTKILAANYRFEGDSLVLNMPILPLADIDIASLEPHLPKPLALSCIEYDTKRNIFWLLTSMESDTQGNCAYLWWASESDLKQNKMHLVKNKATQQPLKFTHKAEDLALIGDNRLFVIHDDDRNRTTVGTQNRKPHQAAYSIVRFP
ncbi:MAG: hypothetical protein R2822_17825 [Spirosomataceae bacterium]